MFSSRWHNVRVFFKYTVCIKPETQRNTYDQTNEGMKVFCFKDLI